MTKTNHIFFDHLSEEEFNLEMLKAHNDFENRRTYSLEEVMDAINKELGNKI